MMDDEESLMLFSHYLISDKERIISLEVSLYFLSLIKIHLYLKIKKFLLMLFRSYFENEKIIISIKTEE
jgi:hypothetical protein